MTRSRWALLALTLPLAVWAADVAVVPGIFERRAALEGQAPGDSAARVELPRAVVAGTRSFADLRLFDEGGQEVPWAIHRHHLEAPHVQPTPLAIVSYAEPEAGVQILTLQVPEGRPPIDALTFELPERDFRLAAEIQVSDGPPGAEATWRTVRQDVIFDLSSRVALRRTTVELEEPVTARLLRARLTSKAEVAGTTADEGWTDNDSLFFRRLPAGRQAARVNQVLGRHPAAEAPERHHDTATFPDPPARDEGGMTRISLGRVDLPAAYVELDVTTPFFHRPVEIWSAERDEPNAWVMRGEGTIYRIPGMDRAEARLALDLPQLPLVELRIRDDDNPPLKVKAVTLGWVRQALYFIPEAGHTYQLLLGAPDVAAPRYEVAHLLPADPAALQSLPTFTVGPVGPNPAFDPTLRIPPEANRARLERYAFTLVVLVIVAVMGVWVYRLMRQLPGPGAPSA